MYLVSSSKICHMINNWGKIGWSIKSDILYGVPVSCQQTINSRTVRGILPQIEEKLMRYLSIWGNLSSKSQSRELFVCVIILDNFTHTSNCCCVLVLTQRKKLIPINKKSFYKSFKMRLAHVKYHISFEYFIFFQAKKTGQILCELGIIFQRLKFSVNNIGTMTLL